MEKRTEKFSRNKAVLEIAGNRFVYRRDREAEENGKCSVS